MKSRLFALSLPVCLVVCYQGTAFAQKKDKAQEADAAAKQRAEDASKAFKNGQELFDNADYVGAIESFNKAYELRPHFLVLCNIALCYERQNEMIKSAKYYKRCLDEGGRKSGQGDAVETSLERVEGRITWLKIRSAGQAGTIYVDGRKKGPTPSRIPVNPGTHVIEVRSEGAKPATTSLSTRGGEEKELTLTPEPKEEPRPPVRRGTKLHQAWFWSAAGLAVVFATVATITGVQTLGIRDDYDSKPTRDLRDKGLDRRLVTNIMWAGAAVAAGSATALYFFTDRFPWTKESRSGGRQATVVGVGLRGTF